MNRAELVEILASKNDLSKNAANGVLETLIETIQTAVKKGRCRPAGGLWNLQAGQARGPHRQESRHGRGPEDSRNHRAQVCGWCQVQSRGGSQGCQAQGSEVNRPTLIDNAATGISPLAVF